MNYPHKNNPDNPPDILSRGAMIKPKPPILPPESVKIEVNTEVR
jgi:hypothetical protein